LTIRPQARARILFIVRAIAVVAVFGAFYFVAVGTGIILPQEHLEIACSAAAGGAAGMVRGFTRPWSPFQAKEAPGRLVLDTVVGLILCTLIALIPLGVIGSHNFQVVVSWFPMTAAAFEAGYFLGSWWKFGGTFPSPPGIQPGLTDDGETRPQKWLF
jgi:hypothetical protein